MVKIEKKIYLIYFGKRGGGVGFHNDVYHDLIDGGYEVCSVTASDLESNSGIEDELKLKIPRNNSRALRSFRLLALSMKIFRDIAFDEKSSLYIFTMLHPGDLMLRLLLRTKRKSVISIIHDQRSHKGELFPPKFLVRLVSKLSSTNLYLSIYVAKQNGEDQIKRVIDFPNSSLKTLNSHVKKDIDILMYGRFKRYKGIELFASTLSELKANYTVVVAGLGQPRFLNASQIDRWLSDSEIASLLTRSKLVVCPYLEATQSGIVNQAHKYGVPVVVTPTGGLPEQIDQKNGIVAKSCHPKDLAEALEVALNSSWDDVAPTKLYGSICQAIDKFITEQETSLQP